MKRWPETDTRHCRYGNVDARFVIVLLCLLLPVPLMLVASQEHASTPPGSPSGTPGKFVDITVHSGIDFRYQASHTSKKYLPETMGAGVALFDYDNDGRVDAVVNTNEGPAYVLHNETPTENHWILLKLTGHRSNRDGIGAEVKVVTTSAAQFATVTTTSSYLSAGDKRVHFGLGESEVVQQIQVRWPSGIVQTLKDVHANQILQIDEPSGSPRW